MERDRYSDMEMQIGRCGWRRREIDVKMEREVKGYRVR